jgi:BirA family biotin operon repressor/biotin-[acetyl-CoA-carboxylase] ligase
MTTRERILARLLENRDKWVSGEELSREIGVSRAAVSKQIGILKGEGYGIESVSRKGYRLIRRSGQLTASEIRNGLRTSVIGQREIRYFQSTDSTNQEAKRLALDGAAEGTLVVAETQTGGKGRKGRPWMSPPGKGIYVSVVLRPEITPDRVLILPLLVAVAAAGAVEAVADVRPELKWPNDLLLNGKKIAGILLEGEMDPDTVHFLVLGLGMNVNTDPGALGELADRATSLSEEQGKLFDRVVLLQAYLERFEALYTDFLRSGPAEVIRMWKSGAGILGRRMTVESFGRTHSGVVRDITEEGALVLESDQGRLGLVRSGDVLNQS